MWKYLTFWFHIQSPFYFLQNKNHDKKKQNINLCGVLGLVKSWQWTYPQTNTKSTVDIDAGSETVLESRRWKVGKKEGGRGEIDRPPQSAVTGHRLTSCDVVLQHPLWDLKKILNEIQNLLFKCVDW
jgi:hypothetical protein